MIHYFKINKNEMKHAEILGLQWDKVLCVRFIDSEHENFKEVMKVFGESEIDKNTAMGRRFVNPDNPNDHALVATYFKYMKQQRKDYSRQVLIEGGLKEKRKGKKHTKFEEVTKILRQSISLAPLKYNSKKYKFAVKNGAIEEVQVAKTDLVTKNGEQVRKGKSYKTGRLFVWTTNFNAVRKLLKFIPVAYFRSIAIDSSIRSTFKGINQTFNSIASKLVPWNATFDQKRIAVANYFAEQRIIK